MSLHRNTPINKYVMLIKEPERLHRLYIMSECIRNKA